MIQHIWTVPCRVSLTNQETNNVSLIEVMEELVVDTPHPWPGPEGQLALLLFDIVTLWGREESVRPEVGYARTALVSPQGETVLEQLGEVDLQPVKRLRAVARVVGFPARSPGVYWITIERRGQDTAAWEEVARVPLEVVVETAVEPPGRDGEANPPT